MNVHIGKRGHRRQFHRVGRRGAVLISYGILWCLFALATAAEPSRGSANLLHERIPDRITAAIWLVTGLVAIVHAWAPPGRSDAPGFIALYLMPTFRALSYVLGWIDSFDGHGGSARGWLAALFYVAFMSTIVIVAGWKEPAPEPDGADGRSGS